MKCIKFKIWYLGSTTNTTIIGVGKIIHIPNKKKSNISPLLSCTSGQFFTIFQNYSSVKESQQVSFKNLESAKKEVVISNSEVRHRRIIIWTLLKKLNHIINLSKSMKESKYDYLYEINNCVSYFLYNLWPNQQV